MCRRDLLCALHTHTRIYGKTDGSEPQTNNSESTHRVERQRRGAKRRVLQADAWHGAHETAARVCQIRCSKSAVEFDSEYRVAIGTRKRFSPRVAGSEYG